MNICFLFFQFVFKSRCHFKTVYTYSINFVLAKMTDISSPNNPDEAVVALPDHQFPYGSDCELTRRFQSVLFHYDIRPEIVGLLQSEHFLSVKQVRFANPDGASDEQELFDALSSQITSFYIASF